MSDKLNQWCVALFGASSIVMFYCFLVPRGEIGLAIMAFCMLIVLITLCMLMFQPNFKPHYQESDILDDDVNEYI